MTVVVGVEGAGRSLAAIRLAAREAGYRGTPLIALMAYSGERALGASATRPVASLRTDDDDRIVAESLLHDAGGHGHGSRGVFGDRSHHRSPQLWMSQHARVSSGFLAGAAVFGGFLAGRLGRRR